MNKEDNKESRPFRILSIDGGGIRGIIPAKGLAMIEEELAKHNRSARICDYFDLICGTSTGAILALGLALGIPAKKLLNLYLTHAEEIFPKNSKLNMILKVSCNSPIYDRKRLSKLIMDTYGEVTDVETALIGHCLTRICVPTYDVANGEMHVFKTSHHEELVRDYQIPAHHVALASAAAPIYFDSYSFDYALDASEETNSYRYNVDGGIMANNPTLIGYVEAIKTLGQRPENLRILSLGTGEAPYMDKRDSQSMGGRYWITNKLSFFAFYDLISSAQSKYIDNTMKFLQTGVGSGTSPEFIYERIQQVFLRGKNIALNASDELSLKALERIGSKLFQGKVTDIIDNFCLTKKQEFVPSHKLKSKTYLTN